LEVEYHDEKGTLYFFKYPIKGGSEDEYLPVATSRPETILGDTAVAVNPKDERFKHLIGHKAVVPFVGREVPIVGDENVDLEFGTGALKVTPAHDMNDYQMGKKHNLEFVKIMNKDGTLNGTSGKYADLDRFEAREKIWEDMKAMGMALKTESYETRVPKSQRGGEVIEPMLSEQWFVEMKPLADPSLKAVRDGDIQIVPQRFEKVYNNWLENIQDWCISRQLWWGHRIPAWYVYGNKQEAESGHSNGHTGKPYIVAANEAEAYEKAKEIHGDQVHLVQEEDVLDTWFSSSLWPFSTLGWPNLDSEDFKRFYPTSMLETGHDILFFWVARMIMMGMHLTGEVPFHTVYLHGLIRDSEGRKMSKTLGNVIDPLTVIDEYGTDALRFTLATGTTPGQDLNLSLEKIESSRNLVNKVWNASKFVSSCLEKLEEQSDYVWSKERVSGMDAASLPFAEKWILAELANLVDNVEKAHERHDIGEAGRAVYNFFWGQFADWYLEIAKTRLYSDNREEAEQCMDVLMHVFLSSLQLLHPYMPFVTEEIWQALADGQGSIMTSQWPAVAVLGLEDKEVRTSFSVFQDAVRSVRNIRAEQQVPVNKKISALFMIESDRLKSQVLSEEKALQFLCKIEDLRIIEKEEANSLNSDEHIESIVNDGFCAYIPLAGLVDAEQEISRLKRQATKIEKDLATLESRLSSPSFVEKAPKKVVEETTMKRDDLTQQLNMVKGRLDVLVESTHVG
jgi:valyl-tRNA synthetase